MSASAGFGQIYRTLGIKEVLTHTKVGHISTGDVTFRYDMEIEIIKGKYQKESQIDSVRLQVSLGVCLAAVIVSCNGLNS